MSDGKIKYKERCKIQDEKFTPTLILLPQQGGGDINFN
jgi:hypothetical protein